MPVIDVEQRDVQAEHTRIRAALKRRRQLLSLEDAQVLIALRELRQQEPEKEK